MKDYYLLHECSLNKKDLGVKYLFSLDKPCEVAIEQTSTTFERDKRNTRQILIDNNINEYAEVFVPFKSAEDAFDETINFIKEELNLESNEEHSLFNKKNQGIAFKIFSRNTNKESFAFRGLIYVTTSNIKPKYYVALNKTLEREYDKEIYSTY